MAYIQFKDYYVKDTLLDHGVGSDGEITYEQAAAVTSMGGWFWSQNGIQLFDELQYFTGLSHLGLISETWNCFDNCYNLRKITIPSGVTTIGPYAFSGCTRLKLVYFKSNTPPTIPSFNEAFSGVSRPITFVVPNGAKNTYLSTYPYSDSNLCNILEEYNDGKIIFLDNNVKQILLNNGVGSNGEITYEQAAAVTSIGQWFRNKDIDYFDELQYFTGLTSIEEKAFHSTPIFSITFPNSLKTIGDRAFQECYGPISLIIPSGVTSIGYAAFDVGESIHYLVIPDSVTTIGDRAFQGCGWIKKLEIPYGVTSIGERAFYACIRINSFTIPNSVTSIGDEAFRDCWVFLKSVTISDNVKDIPTGCFMNCKKLETVVLPSSSSEIYGSGLLVLRDNAFSGCTSLSDIYFSSGYPPYIANFNTFKSVPTPITAHVPKENLGIYSEIWPYSDSTKFTLVPYLSKPVITPSGGTVAPPQIINISAPSAATVYYTLDGTEPTSASTQYTAPFAINESCTVKAIAYETDVEPSFVTIANFTIVKPSPLPPRPQGNVDGIHVAGITYSGTTRTETRSLTLPTPTSSDNEALVEWEYLINGDAEDLGPLGTKCKVEDTEITIHINFEYNGETYSLDKVIPVTCQVGHVEQKREQLILDNAYGIVTLQDKLNINVKGRIKYTSDNQSAIITDPSGYTLQGFTSNGNFTCDIEGSYFVYNHTLINDYSTTPDPANQVYLSLRNSNNEEVDSYVIQVTYEAGAILDVKADAIRMAVQSGNTYTDGQISGVTNQISQLTITVSGITGTVSDMSTTVSGHTQQISQLQQTSSAITATVSSLSEDVSGNTESISQLQITASGITTTVSGLTNEVSELSQTVSSITINIYDELNEKTGIDVSAGTITFTANNGLYVNDSNNNTRITIAPSTVGIKEDHTWETYDKTEIGMDGFYSGTQDNHMWNGQDEIELKHGDNQLNLSDAGIDRSVMCRSNQGATQATSYVSGALNSINVRVITPTANNQSYQLDKYDGLVILKNYSPTQYTTQLQLPDANTCAGTKIMIKPLHTTYITASNDIYPCGDSVPYSQGSTGVNIDNDAMIYVSDGSAWYEFKGI